MDGVCVIMYYNKSETINGNGLYPVFERTIKDDYRIDITFSNINDKWVQCDKQAIYGLDKYTGMYLLKILNNTTNKQSGYIRNIGGRIIYPFIYEYSTFKIIKHYLH
jgi:hypothetical protein